MLVAVVHENEAFAFHLSVGHNVLCQALRKVHFRERHGHFSAAREDIDVHAADARQSQRLSVDHGDVMAARCRVEKQLIVAYEMLKATINCHRCNIDSLASIVRVCACETTVFCMVEPSA